MDAKPTKGVFSNRLVTYLKPSLYGACPSTYMLVCADMHTCIQTIFREMLVETIGHGCPRYIHYAQCDKTIQDAYAVASLSLTTLIERLNALKHTGMFNKKTPSTSHHIRQHRPTTIVFISTCHSVWCFCFRSSAETH